MKLPSLETLLVSPDFFALTTASPVQRAACRVIDGLPLGELALCADVIDAFGGTSAIAALPVGVLPGEVDLYSGIRTAKSLLAAALAVRATQIVDLSKLRPGEVPRIPIVSLDLDKARVVFQHLTGTIAAKPALRSLLVGEPQADSLMLRHPSGREVEIKVVAGSRAGGHLVARWLAGAIFDEKPRMLSAADDTVVNYEDAASAAEGRLLPGAQIIGIGSPYAPWGAAYEDVRKCWGYPTRHKVVIKAPAPSLNPMWWTPQRCADLREKNPRAYKTDVLAEFADATASALEIEWVDASIRQPRRPFRALSMPIGVVDASAGRGDSFVAAIGQWVIQVDDGSNYECDQVVDSGITLDVLRRDANGNAIRKVDAAAPKPFLYVFGWFGLDGKFCETHTLDDVVDQIARGMHAHGVTRLVGDAFMAFALESMFAKRHLRYRAQTWTQETKLEALSRARTWFRDKAIVLQPCAEVEKARRELYQLREKLTASGGVSIGARRGGHDDRAALVLNLGMLDAEGEFHGSPIKRDRRVHAGGASPVQSTAGAPQMPRFGT